MFCHFLNQNTTKETPIRTGFSSFIFLQFFWHTRQRLSQRIPILKDALQNQLLEVVFFQNCVLAANPGIK
jgi:hypothetical protein